MFGSVFFFFFWIIWGLGLALIDKPSQTLPVMGTVTCTYMKLGKNKFWVVLLHFLSGNGYGQTMSFKLHFHWLLILCSLVDLCVLHSPYVFGHVTLLSNHIDGLDLMGHNDWLRLRESLHKKPLRVFFVRTRCKSIVESPKIYLPTTYNVFFSIFCFSIDKVG